MTFHALAAIAPLVILGCAIACAAGPRFRPKLSLFLAEAGALFAFVIALLSAGFLVMDGAATDSFAVAWGLGLSIRVDAVSVLLFLLVTFIGWVVVRYAARYLDGEEWQGTFMAWLCATLASVLLLVLAGNIGLMLFAWIATSLGLHKLLLFYAERPAARRAARKKFVLARIGDGALAGACVLLFAAYGTGDIASILDQARAGEGGTAAIGAAAFLALAAVLKSAQFPTHGWLTEVMETPTPVSALLHAGVINAGGFVLIRMADVMLLAPGVLAVLAMVGGFTAIFAAAVMLTQPAIKTSLAWSTIAQMGFMIFECGLGLFPLALLHIVAHSLYKAHAFLSSGEAVATVAAAKRPGPVAVPGAKAVLRAFLVTLVLYVGIGLAFGMMHKSPQAIALGAILIFGVAYMLAQGFADIAPRKLTRWTAIYAVTTSVSYFALQDLFAWMTAGALPATPQPGALEWAVLVLAVTSFAGVAVLQAMFPLWAHHPAAAGLRVHLANGLYANAIADRLAQSWRDRPAH